MTSDRGDVFSSTIPEVSSVVPRAGGLPDGEENHGN